MRGPQLQPLTSYVPIQQLIDKQPVRAACFHPSGEAYVVGSNSKALRICKYPSAETIESLLNEAQDNLSSYSFADSPSLGQNESVLMHPVEPEVFFTCLHIHCGSIYCTAFNQAGDLLATGSNDQIIHIIKYNATNHSPIGSEYKLSIHEGTVRDVCFLSPPTKLNDEWAQSPSQQTTTNLLASAGAGKYEVNISDCNVMKCIHSFKGHESTVMSLDSSSVSSNTFVSGSLDGTIRVWDLRSKTPASEITTTAATCCVRFDPTSRMLASGQQDGDCMLYDIRASKVIQLFKIHEDEVRTLNFSPKSYYLLTGSYDHKIKLIDIQGQLTSKLPSVDVADLGEKCIQTAWHPKDLNFLTTCANGSATLWTIPT